MKLHHIKWLTAATLMIASLTGCGGGGGGSSSPPQATGNTVITGTASAGIIYPGTINVYAVSASGTKGALLGSAATSVDGKYSVALGAYSGAINVEATGTYTDEATGNTVNIAAAKPLHALMDSVDYTSKNNRIVSVTPLTELAWRKATSNGAAATPATITAANKLVTDLFKVSDILSIEPVRPDTATMGDASTRSEARAYTLVLATLSQVAKTKTGATDLDKLEAMLSGMATEISSAETSGSFSSGTITEFSTAMGLVSLSADFPTTAEELSSVGKKSQTLTFSLSGTLPAGTTVSSIQGTIVLPVAPVTGQHLVSVRANSNGQTYADVFAFAGTTSGTLIGNYQPLQHNVTFSVMLTPSIGIKDFAVLTYDVASGATVAAKDFSFETGTVLVKDANGVVIPGVTVILK
jgi:hypothetical protein